MIVLFSLATKCFFLVALQVLQPIAWDTRIAQPSSADAIRACRPENPVVPCCTRRARPLEGLDHVSSEGLSPNEGSIKTYLRTFPCFPFRSRSDALRSTATSFILAHIIEGRRIPRPRRLRARGGAFAVAFLSHPTRPAHRILVYVNPAWPCQGRQSSCIFSPFVHRVLSSLLDRLTANRAVPRRSSRWSLSLQVSYAFYRFLLRVLGSRHPGLFFLFPSSELTTRLATFRGNVRILKLSRCTEYCQFTSKI